ncbi:hypothetical protein KKF91_08940 [Myxococcota bacterium]|nr:hypothetical protein [Myxococcota bacterium]
MTTSSNFIEPLLGICEDFTRRMEVEGPQLLTAAVKKKTQLVFPEPYLPRLPAKPLGILVLAESQNLSMSSQAAYVRWLKEGDAPHRFLRLAKRKNEQKIGVQPWDDGILKYAVEAAFGVKPEEVAVSNAIPWSWVEGKANFNSFSSGVIRLAGEFWEAMLEHLNPELVVAAGAVARKVMKAADWPEAKTLHLTLPSPRLGTAAGMFEPKDMMDRYRVPEVIKAKILGCDDDGLCSRQAFYVCHALSRARARPLEEVLPS